MKALVYSILLVRALIVKMVSRTILMTAKKKSKEWKPFSETEEYFRTIEEEAGF